MAIDIKSLKSEMSFPQSEKTAKSKEMLSFLSKDIKLWGKGLKDKKKEAFYSELSILLSSGIDIRSTLDIIVEEQKAGDDKELFQRIKNDVVAGLSLSDSINKSNKFTAYEFYSVKIGEESGRLKEVLDDLASYYTKKIKQRRQLSSALTYPILVMITAILAVIFMMTFIVPMFMDVFKRFNGEMPGLTRVIISISVFIKSYLWIFLLLSIIVSILLMSMRKKEFFRAKSSSLMLKLPFFGELIQKMYITRFCQSMSLLLGAKTPMLKSLELVRNMISFYPFERIIDIMKSDILHGKLLNESMSRFTLFDSRIISLVRVAEEVNQLDVIFSKLNNQYNDELEHNISMLSSLLEPIMIIFVGVLVSIILIAMYLPMFQLSSSIY
jgi:type IV pilus assembly protein PilC